MKTSTIVMLGAAAAAVAFFAGRKPASATISMSQLLNEPTTQEELKRIEVTYGSGFRGDLEKAILTASNAAEAFEMLKNSSRAGVVSMKAQAEQKQKELAALTAAYAAQNGGAMTYGPAGYVGATKAPDIVPNADVGRYQSVIGQAMDWKRDNPRPTEREVSNIYQSLSRSLRHIRSSIQQDARNRYSENLITYEQKTAQENEARTQYDLAFSEVSRIIGR